MYLAAKAGLTGETASGPPRTGSAQAVGMVNPVSRWLGQIWTLTLLASALLPKSLFPTRGFRPDFQNLLPNSRGDRRRRYDFDWGRRFNVDCRGKSLGGLCQAAQ